jgi:hypothetical protein
LPNTAQEQVIATSSNEELIVAIATKGTIAL